MSVFILVAITRLSYHNYTPTKYPQIEYRKIS